MKTIGFQSADQRPLKLIVWHPEITPRAVMLIVHGMAEHIARYGRLADFLVENGVIAAGFDLPGHGPDADPERLGYFADEKGSEKIVRDIHSARQLLTSAYPGCPFVLFGHSMGSFLVRRYIQTYPAPDALVLSGTGEQPRLLKRIGYALASLGCLIKGKRAPGKIVDALAFSSNSDKGEASPYSWLSRDKAEVKKYEDDPLCGFMFTYGAYRDFFQILLSIGTKEALNGIPRSLPVYFMSGDQDPVGGQGAGVRQAHALYQSAGFTSLTLRLYEGARHELLNETNRDQVMRELADWVLKTV